MARTPAVQIPAALLLDPDLTAHTRLIWAALRLHAPAAPARPPLLEKSTGLARETVLKGLAHLTATGWCEAGPAGHTAILRSIGPGATLPGALLANRQIGVQGRVLYGILQCSPEYRHNDQKGEFTYPGLTGLTHTSRNTVKQAIRELVAASWLEIDDWDPLVPIPFRIHDPVEARARGEAEAARLRIAEARYPGEQRMKEWLSLLVESDEYLENARPELLINPYTNELLEFDRYYYSARVAFEFNGAQHDRPTGRFTAMDVARQKARDLMKAGICTSRGMTLVVVHAEDLTLERMRQKVGTLLPLRCLERHEPLIAFLAETSG